MVEDLPPSPASKVIQYNRVKVTAFAATQLFMGIVLNEIFLLLSIQLPTYNLSFTKIYLQDSETSKFQFVWYKHQTNNLQVYQLQIFVTISKLQMVNFTTIA